MSRLRIDALEAGGGRLGLTSCPGRRQGGGRGGGGARDLAADLAAIRAFGARVLVTLAEQRELEEMGVEGLGDAAEAAGLDWHHLPVPDWQAIEDQAGWLYLRLRLERCLAAGGSAVLHCKGGLGRTGTAAARLLIERGERPEAAIARVRAVRPGSIETEAQERQLMALAPGEPLPARPAPAERILGCLLGGALGDGFGYALEFDSLAEIRRRHGAAGLRSPVYRAGRLQVSDDTQMTLFTAEGLLCALSGDDDLRGAVPAVWQAYRRWLDTQGLDEPSPRPRRGGLIDAPELRAARAPGRTCVSAIAAGRPGTIAERVNHSKGCGGVMRVAPAGLLPAWLDAGAAFDLAAALAALTHGHPSGFYPAAALAALVRTLLDGVGIEAAVDEALGLLEGHAEAGETAMALGAARTPGPGLDPAAVVARLGQGWVGEEALSIALFAALAGASFEEVVAIAANHDGDSDSTAAIAGQIFGARHGAAALPHAWVRRLDVLGPLLAIGHDLWACQTGRPLVGEYAVE